MTTQQPVIGFHGFFRGTDDDEHTPGNFLRLYQRYMEGLGKSPGLDWVTGFANYLYEDSPAEDWYKGLLPASLADWPAFQAAFLARWKLAKKAVKTPAELQQEMLEYRLKAEVLGTKVTVGGREVWAHVQWAKHMLELATKAGIAASTQNIWLIRRELPDLIKEFVSETHADWPSFTQTVADIDISKLRDKVEAKVRRDGELARVQATIHRLESQFQRLSTAPAQYQPANAPPYRRSAAGPSPAVTRPATPAPQANVSTPPRRDTVRQAMNTLPHHPDTDTGRAAYQTQFTRFTETHGFSPYITERTPVPLRPGTKPLCSGECWFCGQQGHRGEDCQATPQACVPDVERKWRSFCQRMMRDTAPRVQYVSTEEAPYEPRVSWADRLDNMDELSGNGQGPPA